MLSAENIFSQHTCAKGKGQDRVSAHIPVVAFDAFYWNILLGPCKLFLNL